MRYRLFVFVILLLPAVALGSDDDDIIPGDIDIDIDAGDVVTGDVNVPVDVSVPVNVPVGVQTGSVNMSSSSKTFAFSHSLGDVDINDCLASTQWATILVSRQKVNLNQWCAGEVYDAKGLPIMAAIMRCNIPEIRDEFDTEDECRAANTVQVVLIAPQAQPAPSETTIYDRAARYEESDEREQERQQAYSRLDELEERMDREAAVRRAYARQAQADKEHDRQRAQEALDAYKEAQQNE